MSAAAIVQGAGTVLSVIGSLEGGRAAEALYNYDALAADRNAQVARQQATANEAALRRSTRRSLGAMRAAYAASGLRMDGSALDVMEDSAAAAELDALNVRYQGELAAIGFADRATMSRAAGQNAVVESRYRAASALFQGGASYMRGS